MILGKALLVIWFALRIYFSILVIGIILTWFPRSFDYKLPRIIRKMSNWYLERFTGIVVLGSIDFTTIIGLLLYEGVLDLLRISII